MADLPAAAVKRLIVKNSGDMRIGATALDLALSAAEAYIEKLAALAGERAKKDKRKTILDADIAHARSVLGPPPGAAPPA